MVQPLAAARDVVCEVSSRSFRCESDKARHKYVEERQKPVKEQQYDVQYNV